MFDNEKTKIYAFILNQTWNPIIWVIVTQINVFNNIQGVYLERFNRENLFYPVFAGPWTKTFNRQQAPIRDSECMVVHSIEADIVYIIIFK